jgi:SAM-dependent methyltransferase
MKRSYSSAPTLKLTWRIYASWPFPCGRFRAVHDDGYFDERVAARYDDSSADMFDPAVVDPVVDFLVELAGNGRALELGIGTGRIALPLAQRGVPVHGIELSKAMAARLRAKPGGEDIGVAIGDFATTMVDGTFSVAYLVFNTISNLTTQAAQVACFRNVAAHLEPGGCLVIEVGVPALQRLPPGETIRPFHVSETRWGFDEYEVANQGLTSHHLRIVDGRVERNSVPFRYTWPSELDLMAQLAGMKLRDRWSGWKRVPFTSDSRKHVSVWEKPATETLVILVEA